MPDLTREDSPLIIIEEEASAMARCFGVVAYEEAAASLVDRILLRLGGSHIYLPRRSIRERERTHLEISKRFNGRNLFELAREFDLSPRHLRRILSERRNGAP